MENAHHPETLGEVIDTYKDREGYTVVGPDQIGFAGGSGIQCPNGWLLSMVVPLKITDEGETFRSLPIAEIAIFASDGSWYAPEHAKPGDDKHVEWANAARIVSIIEYISQN